MVDASVNTDFSFAPHSDVLFDVTENSFVKNVTTINESIEDNESESDDDNSSIETDTSFSDNDSESEYCPSDNSESDFSDAESQDESSQFENINDQEGMKFITFFSSLLVLLKFCLICRLPAKIDKIYTKGTMLLVKLLCECGHRSSWCSQPEVNGNYLGNVFTVASVIFGGGTFTQFESFANVMKLQIMSKRSFYYLQKKYVYPAINYTYKMYQNSVIDECKKRDKIEVSGDARCDSPGYNAKYSTYSIMDQHTSKILHFQVVTVRETGSSNAMELHGLVKVLAQLEEFDINIDCLTTDEHPSIKKYLRGKSNPRHQLDVWHKSKNIKKKLTKAANNKFCTELQGWIKSILNHFWWSSSTCRGSEVILREKWTSVLFHIADMHEFKENTIFTKCEHEEIEERRWLTPGMPAHNVLRSIVMDKQLLKNLKYFTEFKHTGNLEVFHSLLLKYCPKRIHFSHLGMIARTQLVVLHFNAIINAEHAVTKDGVPRYKLQFSKVTQSCVVKPIKCVPEKKFLVDLMSNVLRSVTTGEQYELPDVPQFEDSIDKPTKVEVIRCHRSRFKAKTETS